MRALPRAQDTRFDPAKQHRGNCPDLRWLSASFAKEDLRGAHGIRLGVEKIAGGNYYLSVLVKACLAYHCLLTESQVSHLSGNSASLDARKQDISGFKVWLISGCQLLKTRRSTCIHTFVAFQDHTTG